MYENINEKKTHENGKSVIKKNETQTADAPAHSSYATTFYIATGFQTRLYTNRKLQMALNLFSKDFVQQNCAQQS